MIRSRSVRTTARAAVALGLAAATVGGGQAPAGATPQPMGRCTTTSGVVLAVDFSDWGGPLFRSCGTTPTTGYELLNQGGWRTTGTGHDGPAFICRIGYSGYRDGRQFPTPAEDDCVLTPPASAYWSYWHADPGRNDWEYSRLGAMLYRPRPGSVDLWMFGGTDIGGTEGRPTVTPDQLRAHNTQPIGDTGRPPSTDRAPAPPPGAGTGPAPERRPPSPPGPAPSAPAVPAPASTEPEGPGTRPGPTESEPSRPATSRRSAGPTHSPSPTSTSAPSVVAAPGRDAEVVDAAPATEAPHDSGSIVPVVAGASLVALIGGAAVHAARRRRGTR
ncbi:hypothetical protein [Streptomyces sp. SHP 1-2]|uniref:hypothetical protein n=1 Tax=Streptomyces sp. SHP 1-2 TaxID=2769489 RepID=UPI002237350A|nr:hypothetical protein [Streptomyces sp. SHP 1-2]MCW5249847.1 hypothetical protein [Streptomyces sp. SHP 1-2]